jgi:hypothetical protein
MRYLFSLIFFVMLALPSVSQIVVGNVDINKADSVRIIEVLIAEKLSNKSVNVFVDFGQKSNFRSGYLDNNSENQRIVDPETKKEIRFKSASALLNYMEVNNWEHYDTAVVRDKSEQSFYYYFKKRKK